MVDFVIITLEALFNDEITLHDYVELMSTIEGV